MNKKQPASFLANIICSIPWLEMLYIVVCFFHWITLLACIPLSKILAEDGFDADTIVLTVFLILSSLSTTFIVISSFRNRKRTTRFREYVAILSGEPVKTLERIAEVSLFTHDAEAVRRDIEKMIDLKYFTDVYINDAHEVVTANTTEMVNPDSLVTVLCDSCGGVNQLPKGTSCTCAFCGATVQSVIEKRSKRKR